MPESTKPSGADSVSPDPPAAHPAPPPAAWDAEASQADRLAFLNQLGEGVIIADRTGRIVFVNDAAKILHGQALLGVAPDDYTASYNLLTMAGDPFPVDDLPLTRAVRHGEITVDTRWRIRRADGTEILAIGNARPMYDKHGKQVASILNIRDDTQRHADEAALKELLRIKDMLLHEVNHRVKNSLQLVTSLLALQAARSDEAGVRDGLKTAGQRISVIARIHERLYAATDHDSVNIGELLCDLATDNVAAHSAAGRIRVAADCQDFNLALDQAVPLALCTTELVTNAVKYAFASMDGGTITLAARLHPDDRVEVHVADDGAGLPPGFDPEKSAGLGMRIVTALTGQLRARLDIGAAGSGAAFTIIFYRHKKLIQQDKLAVRIMIVEDEMLVALQIEVFLGEAGHDVVGIADCNAAALALAEAQQPDLALVDINLAGGDNGIDLAAQLRARSVQVLLATGNCPPDLTKAVALGCLGKPFGQQDMTSALEAVDATMRGLPVSDVSPALRLF